MMEGEGPGEDVRGTLREPVQHRRVERLLIVRPQDGADGEAAGSDLEDLPGVVDVTLNSVTGSFAREVRERAVQSAYELSALRRAWDGSSMEQGLEPLPGGDRSSLFQVEAKAYGSDDNRRVLAVARPASLRPPAYDLGCSE